MPPPPPPVASLPTPDPPAESAKKEGKEPGTKPKPAPAKRSGTLDWGKAKVRGKEEPVLSKKKQADEKVRMPLLLVQVSHLMFSVDS